MFEELDKLEMDIVWMSLLDLFVLVFWLRMVVCLVVKGVVSFGIGVLVLDWLCMFLVWLFCLVCVVMFEIFFILLL